MEDHKPHRRLINSMAELKPGDHLCAIYETEEEHRVILTPFMRAGLEQNEKVVYIVDVRPAETIFKYLSAEGVDTDSYANKGQLNILTARQTYLKEGIFDPNRMIAFLRSESERALAEGYSALRVTAEMSWSLKGLPGSDRLIEYEAKLNDFFAGSKCLAMCQYDKRHFDADLLLKVLYTHPCVVIGTEIYDNFYYITPNKMLGPQPAEEILNTCLKNLRDTEQAAETLKLSEERYILSERAANIGSWDWDIQNGRLTWSETIEPLFGFGRGDFGATYEAFLECVHPDDRKHVVDSVNACIEKGESYAIEHRIVWPDGALHWISERGDVFRDQNGKAIRMLGIVQDITDRKTAEESVRQRTYDLGERVKELGCLYGISNLVEKPGTSLDEILQGTANLIPPSWQYPEITCARIILDDRVYKTDNFSATEWKQASDIALDSKRVGAVEVYYTQKMPKCHDGPFLAEEKNLIDAIAERLGRIIERIRSAEELGRTKQMLENISHGISDAIILLSRDYRIMWANKAALEQAGLRMEEVLGQYCYRLTHGHDKPCPAYGEICPVDQIFKTGKTIAVAHKHIDGRGEKGDVEITAYPIKDEKGEIIQFVHLCRDITERKQTEEKMKQAHREILRVDQVRSDFTSMVSHELRTPLSSIKEGIDIVFEGIDGPVNEAQRDTLGIAKRNVDRLARLINNVLDFSRLESGRMEMVFEKSNVKELITEVCDLMRPRATKESITLSVDLPAEEVVAVCDPDRIKQVITNLVDNAIKFTEGEGRIDVHLSHPPKTIQIEIEDTGIGIKKEYEEKIFEVFSQISRKGVGGKGGSGLGLTICKRITDLHHGKISARSHDGKGSIFTVTFPDDLPSPD